LQPTRRAVQHIHRAGILDRADTLERDPDREIGRAIVVEVRLQTPGRCSLHRHGPLTGRPHRKQGRDNDNHDPPHLHHLLSSEASTTRSTSHDIRVDIPGPWRADLERRNQTGTGGRGYRRFGDVGRISDV
jgi:hypothetical protein